MLPQPLSKPLLQYVFSIPLGQYDLKQSDGHVNNSAAVVGATLVSYSSGALYCVVPIGTDQKSIDVSKIKVLGSVLLPIWTPVKDSWSDQNSRHMYFQVSYYSQLTKI